MHKLTVKDIDLKNKIVLVRADFNVPQDENLNITDDTRIKATLPTIRYILEKSAKKVVLMSHLGRPDGKAVAKYSLKPVAQRLSQLLSEPVKFLNDCVGDEVKKEIQSSEERVILLENLRFHAEEEANDTNFAQ
ncbi:MAG: phosphoglycerate kinase, partial [Candidatus Omnitrophica bacterium]|nr:phosphoglycerate kinase [Candidatus Omnitrophota bacterium]